MDFTKEQQASIASLVSLYTKRHHDIILRHLNDQNINISKIDLSGLLPDEPTIIDRVFGQVEKASEKPKPKKGLKIKGSKPGLKIKGAKPGLKIKGAKTGLKIKQKEPTDVKQESTTVVKQEPTSVANQESNTVVKQEPTSVANQESTTVVKQEPSKEKPKKTLKLKAKKTLVLNKENLNLHNKKEIKKEPESNYQEFYDVAKSLDYDLYEHTETNWKGPAFTVEKTVNVDELKSKFKMDLTILNGKLTLIVHPKAQFDPESVIYDVDPEVESEKSIINSDDEDDSEVEIECIKWVFKGEEYILDETTNNVYLENKFIGKREPGEYQGEYYIDYEAKE